MTQAERQTGNATGLARVRVSPDKLEATMRVQPELAGRPDAAAACGQAVVQAGLAVTPDIEARIASALADASGDEALEAVIAEGQAAAAAKAGEVEWAVDTPEFEALQRSRRGDLAEMPEDAEPDEGSHYERTRFLVVVAGDVLGRVLPPTAAQDGRDVFDEVIPAPEGEPSDFQFDDTIQRQGDGELVAAIDGCLTRDKNSAGIRQQIEVDGPVDFSTGNIDFQGDVTIREGVRDRFTVRARSIEVFGLIEAATLIASQDLRAAGGFAGRELGVARVGGTLDAKYLDKVTGEIGGDLAIAREAINCNLTVGGAIDAPQGAIIGGRVEVIGPCKIGQLGSGGGAPTLLSIGAVPEFDPVRRKLRPMVETLRSRRNALENEQAELEERVNRGTTTPTDGSRLVTLKHERKSVDRMLAKSEPALEKVDRLVSANRVVDLTIERRLHAEAVLCYGGYRYRVLDLMKGPITARDGGDGPPILVDARGELGDLDALCRQGALERSDDTMDDVAPPQAGAAMAA
ncbi:MAG: FapA family protein [Planctomycetota bacterium]